MASRCGRATRAGRGACPAAFFWGGAGAASLSSGLVVDWAGYATLGLIGAGLIAIPAIVLFGTRSGRAIAVPGQ